MEMKKCTGPCGRELEASKENFEFRADTGKFRAKCRECCELIKEKRRAKNSVSLEEYIEKFEGIKVFVKCTGCDKGLERNIENFHFRKDSGSFNTMCRKCITKRGIKYRKEHPEIKKRNAKIYREKHKVKIKEYRNNNKEKKKEYDVEYRKKNVDKRNAYFRKRYHERKDTDLVYIIKRAVSRTIWTALKRVGSSKGGESCFQKLGYTKEKLADNTEYQFEPWMTIDNNGEYDAKLWNDNDPSTWKWQLDHIKPHSEFNYTSMDEQVFRDCWALDNLRPLSAKKNYLDGIYRIRHLDKRTDVKVIYVEFNEIIQDRLIMLDNPKSLEDIKNLRVKHLEIVYLSDGEFKVAAEIIEKGNQILADILWVVK